MFSYYLVFLEFTQLLFIYFAAFFLRFNPFAIFRLNFGSLFCRHCCYFCIINNNEINNINCCVAAAAAEEEDGKENES